jgi:UDP-glucose 4-epimerase
MNTSRAVVTGIAGPLGWRVAERLVASGLELVLGMASASVPVPDGAEVIVVSPEHQALLDMLVEHRIDTVIHTAWWSSDRSARAAHRHVIETMSWATAAAAAHREASVRTFVLASPSIVYPSESGAPQFHPETEILRPAPGSLAASLIEAEQFARDLATSHPHVTVSVLRLADLAGCDPADDLASVIARPLVPAVWGFDPEVQLLHADDAAAALEHAAQHQLAGIYNVAAPGTLSWRQAIGVRRGLAIELPPLPNRLLSAGMRASRLGAPAGHMIDALRFGRCLDIEAITRTGFHAEATTRDCVAASR